MDDFQHIYGAGRPMTIDPRVTQGKWDHLVSLIHYKKHASRFGPELVYETAQEVLVLKDLIELVHHLRALPTKETTHFRAKSGWSLTKEQREELSERMRTAGYKDKAITRVTKG